MISVPPTVILPSLEKHSQEDIVVENEDRAESDDQSHNSGHPIAEALPADSIDTTQTPDGVQTVQRFHTLLMLFDRQGNYKNI